MSRRAEHLFSIIGQVDDAFIDEAACPRRFPRSQRQWTKWAALCAACLLLAVGLWRITPLWPAADGNANGAAPPPTRAAAAAPVLSTAALTVPHPARSLQAMPNLPAGKVRHRNRANCLS